jgi:hypothetical protein
MRRVDVHPHWIEVVRGPAPLDRASFRLADAAAG